MKIEKLNALVGYVALFLTLMLIVALSAAIWGGDITLHPLAFHR